MTHKFAWTITLLFTIGLSPSLLAGKVYKWVDSEGNTHYSQTPPQGKMIEEMNVKAPKPSSSPPAATSKTKTSDKKKEDAPELTEEQQAQLAKNEEIRKENCKRATTHLRTISAGGKIYEVNEAGERVYWDDEMRKAKIDAAQKSVDKWCEE